MYYYCPAQKKNQISSDRRWICRRGTEGYWINVALWYRWISRSEPRCLLCQSTIRTGSQFDDIDRVVFLTWPLSDELQLWKRSYRSHTVNLYSQYMVHIPARRRGPWGLRRELICLVSSDNTMLNSCLAPLCFVLIKTSEICPWTADFFFFFTHYYYTAQ